MKITVKLKDGTSKTYQSDYLKARYDSDILVIEKGETWGIGSQTIENLRYTQIAAYRDWLSVDIDE